MGIAERSCVADLGPTSVRCRRLRECGMQRSPIVGLIVAVVLGITGFAQTLGGTWHTSIESDLTAAVWPAALALSSAFTIRYSISDWVFASYTKLTNAGWNTQNFGLIGALGELHLSSKLELDPGATKLKSLTTSVDVPSASVPFGATFTLSPNGLKLKVSGNKTTGDITIGVAVTCGNLADYDLGFENANIKITFPFACTTVKGEMDFDCTGFDYAKFRVDNILMLSWLTFSASAEFQLESMDVTITPKLNLAGKGCGLNLSCSLQTGGGTSIEGIRIDSIKISHTIDGVVVTGTARPGGSWELSLATTGDGCCGAFGFDMAILSADDSPNNGLFGVTSFEGDVSIQLATGFTFEGSLEADFKAAKIDKYTIGFLLEF